MAVVADDLDLPAARRFSLWAAIRRNPTIAFGAVLLVALIVMAVFAPFLAPNDPLKLSPVNRLRPPSERWWFGTDQFGRDVFSRTIYGARVSLIVGLSVAAFSSVLGLALGLACGYFRKVDGLVMRVMDGLMAIPSILLAIALIALNRASIWNVILAVTIAETPRVVRLIRGVVLFLREEPYVEAARSCGASIPWIVFRHILPNTFAPIAVQATYICAVAILAEAALSFIGAGVPPSTPSWGNIMAEGRALWQIKPYIIFFPALFLSITVLAINMLGDGLRDALDPRLRKRV